MSPPVSLPPAAASRGATLPTRRRSADDVAALRHVPAERALDLAELLPVAPRAPLRHVPVSVYEGRAAAPETLGKGARAALELGARLADDFPAHASSCHTIYPLGFSPTVPLRVTMQPVGGGPSRAAFARYIDGDAEALASIERESRFARRAGELGVGPAVIAFSREKRYLLTDAAPGGLVSRDVLRQPIYVASLMQLARRLHRADPAGLPTDRPVVFPSPYTQALAEAVGAHLMPTAVAARLRRYGDALAAALGRYPAPLQWVHGDLQHGNFIVDAVHQRLTLVDYGMAHLGDAMADLAYFAISVHLPVTAAAAMLASYHDGDRAPSPDHLPRLQLHISLARLVRYTQSLGWWPSDHLLRSRLVQELHADLAEIGELLPSTPGVASAAQQQDRVGRADALATAGGR